MIYIKTAKGQAEIDSRTRVLPPRQRSLLIMLDGKRDTSDLARVVPQQLEAELDFLLANGYIEAASAGAAPARPAAQRPMAEAQPSRPAALTGAALARAASSSATDPRAHQPAPAGAASSAASSASSSTGTAAATAPSVGASPAAERVPSPQEFITLRRDAVNKLTDRVGPMAEPLAIKMEKARNWAELLPMLETAARLINSVRGGSAANEYYARFTTV